MGKEIKVRELKVSDRKKLSDMIKKLVEVAGDESLLGMISSAASSLKAGNTEPGDKAAAINAVNVGVKIFQLLMATLEDETLDWFADLIGVSKDEFLDLPIDTEPVIIQQIIEREEASRFFTIVLQLYSRIEQLQDRFKGMKMKSGTKTG